MFTSDVLRPVETIMRKLLITVFVMAGSAHGQANPFQPIDGSWEVLSCKDRSPSRNEALNICDSKTILVGVLPGDGSIGARFVDVDYVTYAALCEVPVICTSDMRIVSERRLADDPGRTLIQSLTFTRQLDGTLTILVRRQSHPLDQQPLVDGEYEITARKM